MAKRSKALVEAQKKYEQKRITVSCKMLVDTELKDLDRACGDQSRSGFVQEAVQALIERRLKDG